ncbi:P-type conjugative transfer protein VirB9 [Methylocystis sp. MitZ-2018]|jgi:type IV secretion system protein VirB9|nr:MAG: Plasmid conjugal transfer protein [Methylocystaceae bacterium]PWB89121.1 P-type conjugative transfer protein VirB9 [Methylocystis sp. MitZ-2018]TXT43516.1 MAG: Plasmid conjugal transfer protein TrbG/VirB9 [Methylocystaceae bacterium]
MRAISLLLVLTMFAAAPALAEQAPRAVIQDSRIRTVPFQRDNVVVVHGALGVSTMVAFGDDERIETVAIGDSVGWQAVPDQSKRFLFIKPLETHAVTNMNVVTRKRIYNFLLRAVDNRASVVFKVRFTYPDVEEDQRLLALAKAKAAMPNYRALMSRPGTNFDYTYKGQITAKPDFVFDDGIKTYFRFGGEVPAIFLVNPDRGETLVNYRREGEIIVVDKVAGQFTMRKGDETACVFNLRAESAPPPVAREADVQPQYQTEHAPQPFWTQILAPAQAASSAQ